jgi:hypothetical protein
VRSLSTLPPPMTMVVHATTTMFVTANDDGATTAAEASPPQSSSRKPLTLQPFERSLLLDISHSLRLLPGRQITTRTKEAQSTPHNWWSHPDLAP